MLKHGFVLVSGCVAVHTCLSPYSLEEAVGGSLVGRDHQVGSGATPVSMDSRDCKAGEQALNIECLAPCLLFQN